MFLTTCSQSKLPKINCDILNCVKRQQQQQQQQEIFMKIAYKTQIKTKSKEKQCIQLRRTPLMCHTHIPQPDKTQTVTPSPPYD